MRAPGSCLLTGACAIAEDDEDTTIYRFRSTATRFDENRAMTKGLDGNRAGEDDCCYLLVCVVSDSWVELVASDGDDEDTAGFDERSSDRQS
ncbi:unnamed protein product [Linum trigynum]|uniref:Uncharacterized protein n=1 Tax=Linum trigynum TaxID=586398 RepID=A0AAV2FWT9_9ROSI